MMHDRKLRLPPIARAVRAMGPYGDGRTVLLADGPTLEADPEVVPDGMVRFTDPSGEVREYPATKVTAALEPDPLAGAEQAPALRSLSEKDRRERDGENEITDPGALAALVASALEARGGAITAATNADGSISPAAWHAILCVDGTRAEDGREFAAGCFQYPDLPISLRLIIEDEGGHWGAVTCGRIDSIVPQPQDNGTTYHYAEGVFGSDPNGQLGELMVEEQTQRFISVDPRSVTAEEVIIERGGSTVVVDGDIAVQTEPEWEIWWLFTSYVIGAATILSIPCFPQAVITLADVPLPESPIAVESQLPGIAEIIIGNDGDADADDDAAAVVSDVADIAAEVGIAASAAAPAKPAADTPAVAPLGPPAWWFENPAFALGDDRLVLQADERSWACPLTVEDPDPVTGYRRVYGHVAWWNCAHTGYPNGDPRTGKPVTPPHSKADYAYYMTGQGVVCADGSKVTGVGNLTMGTGHAPTTLGGRRLTPAQVLAHYDGGPGAIQAAALKAGEDLFGPWVAGYVPAYVSEAEVAQLCTLNMSGDWREIADAMELLAVLAVPVPGFPIRRALTASGGPQLEQYDTRVATVDGHRVAMVAAGIVRRLDPLARMAKLEQMLVAQAARADAQDALIAELLEEKRLAAVAAQRERYQL